MKKKLLATAASVAALSTMLVVPAVAGLYSDGETAEILGEGYTVAPAIEVALPGDLTFGINPLSLDADGDETADSQIVSLDYVIYNYSQVPVTVKTATKATATTATITDTAVYNALSGEMQTASDSAEIFLLQVLPTDITIADNVATLSNSAVKGSVITGQATAVSAGAYVLSTAANEITFKLAKSTGGALLPAHVGGFSFDGAVDPQAVFTDSDVKVSTVFSLDIISDAQYDSGCYEFDGRFDTAVVDHVVRLTGDALSK